MIQSKTKITELKPKTFQVMERLDADVNVDLFSKTLISVVSHKHHRHPIVACVTHNLFRATATYKIHTYFDSCHTLRGQANACRVRQKEYGLSGEKRDATFHLRVLRYRFRPRSILSRNYKKIGERVRR